MRKGGKVALGMLTACFLGMYGSAVQAQFGGLGAFKKVLDSATNQTPQQQERPATQNAVPSPSTPTNVVSGAVEDPGESPKNIIDFSLPLSSQDIRDIRLNWEKSEGYTNKYIGRLIEGQGRAIENIDDRTMSRNGIAGVNVIIDGKISYSIVCKNIMKTNFSENVRILGILTEIYGSGSGIYSNDDAGEQFYADQCRVV